MTILAGLLCSLLVSSIFFAFMLACAFAFGWFPFAPYDEIDLAPELVQESERLHVELIEPEEPELVTLRPSVVKATHIPLRPMSGRTELSPNYDLEITN
jgi:hypothetical protein